MPVVGALLMLLVAAAGLTARAADDAAPAGRERLLMDFGWRFHLGNEWGIGHELAKAGMGIGPAGTSYSDASWRRVDLPHDWAVELPFDPKANGSHGFKALGEDFPQNSVGWYRRTFALPAADAGRRLWIEFDGVYRDCRVFLNGWFVGHNQSGYNSFRYDITDIANCGGENVLAVEVDATRTEGWFYEGAGIYRHVWLVKTAPVAVAPDGVFVYSRFPNNTPGGPAELQLQTSVANAQEAPADAVVEWTVLAPDGRTVANARQTASVAGGGSAEVKATASVAEPALWSPENPRLYRLVTTVTSGGRAVDRVETEFGIRTVAFDPARGFLLNGQPYVLKGTCNHQDHAGVGAALPDRLQYFRIARLKEMGSNAYRTAHNPPTPELLEACDRLGMLVMDESRLVGSDGRNLAMLGDLVRRDRNHASVAIWSLGNEEMKVQGTPAGREVARTMQALIKRLDPTRPVTYNAPVGNEFPGINEVVEVRGWSYHVGSDMDAYHAAHPTQPNVGSEQASTVTTRGIYVNDAERGYVSSYNGDTTGWWKHSRDWWSYFHARPWLSGGFVWTGFDYRGEPTPYGWPCINSHFGIMDMCGFPKDNFWFYQAWWTDRPVLHLLPHWNWPGREGQQIDVRALSNCDEVELFVNGRSCGRQAMERDSELQWSVPYEPGVLSAKGYKAGQVVAETKVETTGAPAAVTLTPDRTEVAADGEDVAIVTVAVVDAQGRVVPDAGNTVDFALEGPGRIIGVGNGDPSCHEPDVMVGAAPAHTLPIDGWRWKANTDVAIYWPTYLPPDLPEEAVDLDDSSWDRIDGGAATPVKTAEKCVFRTRFNLSRADLDASVIELVFGRIAGGGYVYLNGRRVGETGSAAAASVYDVKAALREGENTLVVGIVSYGGMASLSKGVWLRLQENPAPVAWRRSVFNGYAQILVQAAKESGELQLTARAEGLAPATLRVKTLPAQLRPAVP